MFTVESESRIFEIIDENRTFNIKHLGGIDMSNRFLKDPDAILDYIFDWEDWLEDGEFISSYVITIPDGLTQVNDGKSGYKVTVWLSGGTAGTDYTVSCKIVTSGGRTEERSIVLRVVER